MQESCKEDREADGQKDGEASAKDKIASTLPAKKGAEILKRAKIDPLQEIAAQDSSLSVVATSAVSDERNAESVTLRSTAFDEVHGFGIATLLPCVDHIVQTLTAICNKNQTVTCSEMERWLKLELAFMWVAIRKNIHAKALMTTVHNHLRIVYTLDKVDFSLFPENTSAEDIASCLPDDVITSKVYIKEHTLNAFRNFHYFLLTGSYPGPYRINSDGEIVSMKHLEIMLGDRKRARKAFANCRPLGGHVERQGKITFFKPKQKKK